MDQQRPQARGLFDQMAPTYDHVGVEFFGPVAARLVAELDPQSGSGSLTSDANGERCCGSPKA